jgi:nucleoside-diphosphate-sugar epimerase
MKDVIFGGTGWAASSAIKLLQEKFNGNLNTMEVYGSRARKQILESGHLLNIKHLGSLEDKAKVRYFLPFSFLTVDKFIGFGEEQFRSVNNKLIQHSIDFIARNEPKYCILLSSGIVYSDLSITSRPLSYQVYKELKIQEEESLKSQCKKSGTRLVLCRLFSASGREIQSVKRYAISDLAYQGLIHRKITVTNPRKVLRKYIDMGQLLEICLLAVQEDVELLEFDSTGELVELHDLAALIAQELNLPQTDKYFSESRDSETLGLKFGISLFPIEKQVKETIVGVKKLIESGRLD